MRLDDSTWVPRTAEGTVQEVDSDPWPPVARVAQLARQAGAPVELVRQGAAGRDIVWLTVDPCTCSCHRRRLSTSEFRDLHSPQFGRRCPCESGFSHVEVTELRPGDTVVDGDGTRHVATTRWVMDDYDGTGLVQIEFVEPDRFGATSDTLIDQTLLFTRR